MADQPRLYGPRETYTSQPQLYGPRPVHTNLSRARELVHQERLMRTGTGGSLWGHTFSSGADINRAGRNYPRGFAQVHGGRGVAETRRDQFLGTLRRRRGMQPYAPRRSSSFIGGQVRAGFGGMHRGFQSFVNRRF